MSGVTGSSVFNMLPGRGYEFTYGFTTSGSQFRCLLLPKENVFDPDGGDKRMPASANHFTFAPVNDGVYEGKAECSSEI